jgi:tetratricopeptide (TPR) repeat protein
LRANLVRNGFSSDPAADLASATAAVDRALVLSPTDLGTLTAKAEVARAQGDLEGAAAVLRKLIELRPQYGWGHNALGVILMTQGHYKEALENFIIASQLTVGIGPTAIIDANIAFGFLANDRFPEAIAQARLAISESPPQSGFLAENPWLALIAAESENGQDAEARADLQKFLAAPRRRRTMAEIKKASFLAGNAKLLEGLRRAGMPTE